MNQKGFSPILIILGILLIIATTSGAFYFGKYPTIKSQIQNPVTTSPNPTDETADWQTYTDDKMGYSIKYPADKLSACDTPIDGLFLYEGSYSGKCLEDGEQRTFMYIIEGAKLNEITSPREECYSVIKEQIKFAGVEAFKYSNVINSDTGNCGSWSGAAKHSIDIIIEHNGLIYKIGYFNNTDSELEDQILSTFKFTQ